jgi:hypothetical protein
MLTEQERRPSRVPFKHPVRVETMEGPHRVIRTLSANLSKDGLFFCMPEPLAEGTRLLVSLEAKGAPHALAEGEVRWATRNGVPGCGVLFTRYSHPRSKELLTHLVESIEHNRPARIAGRPLKWRKYITTAVIALLVGGVLAAMRPNEPAPVVIAPVAAVVEAPPAPIAMIADDAVAPEVVDPSPEVVAMVDVPARKHPNVTLTNVRAPVKAPVSLADALKGAPPAVTAQRAAFGSMPTVAGSMRGTMKLPASAAKSLSWEVSPNSVRFAAEGEVIKTMLIYSPARAVIDLKGPKPSKSEVLKLVAPHVKSVRVGELPEGTRIVIDLDKAPSSAKPAGNAIVLTY